MIACLKFHDLLSQGICERFYNQHCYHDQGALLIYICASILAANIVLQQFLTQHHIYKTDGVPKKLFKMRNSSGQLQCISALCPIPQQ